MDTPQSPILTALYVPGDRPDRFEKATGSGADAVIFDLEDAVSPSRKDEARRMIVDYLSRPVSCAAVIRVNGADTPWFAADLDAISRCPRSVSIRLPKCESALQVSHASIHSGGRPIQAVIESAIGVERMSDIANAEATVSIGLGEADLRSALSISDPAGLDWIRARTVIAAGAAGLPAPLMSVWTNLKDLNGLAASCQVGKACGFFGRAAIHPTQLPVIREAFRPSEIEIREARAVLAALDEAASSSSGVAMLPSGHLVDAAMRRGAERIVALAADWRDDPAAQSAGERQ